MESSQSLRNASQIPQKYSETFLHQQQKLQAAAMKYPPHHDSSRRRRRRRGSPSFSSSQSSSSLSSSNSSVLSHNPNSTEYNTSPLTTPNSTPRLSGKPFSWEYFPGIPKKQLSKKMLQNSPNKFLPLPPPTKPTAKAHHNKKSSSTSPFFELSDPFFAALVECSKDHNHDHDHDHDDIDHYDLDDDEDQNNFWSIASAKVSRSFSLYGSCKRNCAVAESIRRRRRPTSARRAINNYDLIDSRSARR